MGNNQLRISAEREPVIRRTRIQATAIPSRSLVARRLEILGEEAFRSQLLMERRRAERSRKPFALMLLNAQTPAQNETDNEWLAYVASIVLKSVRETDFVGWYKNGEILGVIFTEINLENRESITEIFHSKISSVFQAELSGELRSKLAVTVHVFPESWSQDGAKPVADSRLYPDLSANEPRKRAQIIGKRMLDIIASSALLFLLSPLLAMIALAIKLTSKGPSLFQQERLGQFASRFKCLKFRTMYSNNDPKIHKEYVQRYISGQAAGEDSNSGNGNVYKITNDPRVTPIGRFLRKTSMDELPQLWNVLTGNMSLVGPRPPVPYEFQVYDVWHRRRVLEIKPGVTGLWQVYGRSRTCFDDMVRMDLRYCNSWSLWLDLKILLATPRAVFGGDGAY